MKSAQPRPRQKRLAKSPRLARETRPLLLEALEARIAPAVYIVNFGATPFADSTDSATHGGTGTAGSPFQMSSLRGAVLAANASAGADTIMLPAGTYTLSLVGNDATSMAGDLDINDSLTISGAGSGTTIIQGASGYNSATGVYTNSIGDKVIGINQDGTHRGLTVAINDVTIRWGQNTIAAGTPDFSNTGGGVDVFLTGTGNNISFTNTVITQNTNVHSYGGGVNIDSGASGLPGDTATGVARGSVTFTNVTISENRTLDTATQSSGGGVNLFADNHNVTFQDCLITNNSTAGGTANGGGVNIRHTNGGTVTFNNTNITNNTAGGYGGGISTAFNQNVAMTGGNITGNTSLAVTSGDSASGGGFFNGSGTGTTTQLTNVTISSNIATAGTNAHGGGFENFSTGTVTLTNTTITGNSSDIGGGVHNQDGTLNINGGSISNNTAAAGGGFSSLNGTSTISGATISGNAVNGDGGGVYVTGGTVSLLRDTITGNTANNDNLGGGDGGGILYGGGSLTVNFSRIAGNIAKTGGGGGTTGIRSTGAGTVDATNNWWGADANPGAAGTDSTATTGGAINSSPRLDLTLTAGSTNILEGNGTSALTADFTKNSAGTTIAPANLTALIGLPITFAGTLGTISGAQATIQANGTATATYNAGNATGAGSATAQVDNPPAASAAITVSEITASSNDTLVNDVDGDGVADPGDTVRYTVTLTNPSGTLATGINFTDLPGLNTGLVVGTVTTTSGTITTGNTAGNTSVSITGASVSASGTTTITFDVLVDPATTARSISNQGTVTRGSFTISTDDPAVGGAADPTVTALDLPDVKVELLAATSVTEDGAGNLVYTFTRQGPLSATRTINFSISGTASATSDFAVTGADSFNSSNGTGVLTFAAGSATATITVDPTGDTTVENNETVIVAVTPSATGYDVGTPASATGTITNDDTDVSVTVAPSSVAEDGTSNLVYTFTRSGFTTGDLTVSFNVGGSAVFGTDYAQSGAGTFSTTTGTVTFVGNATTATVTLDPTADNTVEGNETAVITLVSGSNYNVSGSPASATITDDDSTINVSIAPGAVAEDSGTPLVYTLTRTGSLTNALDVHVTLSGTASLTGDYSQSGLTSFNTTDGTALVHFNAGSNTATVTITPSADGTGEPDETVILTVNANGTPAVTGGYGLGVSPNAAGTIQNDDTGVSVTIGTTPVAESSTTGLVYTFTRAGDTSIDLPINFAKSGTATATADYTVSSSATTFDFNAGTLTIPAGAASVTVTLIPVDDRQVEGSETAILSVATGPGYAVQGSPATGNITDNDTATLSFSAGTSSAAEGGGTHNIGATLTINAIGSGTIGLAHDLTADLATSGGTATAGADYTVASPAITFLAGTYASGTATQNAVVTLTDDRFVEGDETSMFGLSIAQNIGTQVGLGGTTAHTLTISDNDTATLQFTAFSSMVSEGIGTANVGVVLAIQATGTGPIALGRDVTVAPLTGPTDSADSSDFTLASAITFAAGDADGTIHNFAFAITNDALVEMTEFTSLRLNKTADGTGGKVTISPTGHNLTIIDNEVATIGFAAPTSSVSEGAGSDLPQVVLHITANGTGTPALSKAASVNFGVAGGGTASAGSDYTLPSSVTFGAGSGDGAVMTATLSVINDRLVEGNELAAFGVSAASDAFLIGVTVPVGPSSRHETTITDDDTATLSYASSASSVLEYAGPQSIDVSLTINATGTGPIGLASNLTANIATTGGTAAGGGVDYTLPGNPALTFVAGTYATGTATQSFSVGITNDTSVEGNETATLGLSIAQNIGTQVSLGSFSSHTLLIIDNALDLQVSVAPITGPVVAGSGANNLSYVVSVTNNSGIDATNLSLNELLTLPAGVVFSSANATSGTADASSWHLGTLAAGGTATLTFNLTADHTVAHNSSVSLATSVASVDQHLFHTVDDQDTKTATVIRQNDLSVTVTDSPDPVGPNSQLTYTITVANSGPSDSTTATLTDTFPAALSNVTWSAVFSGGSTGSGSGSGNINEAIVIPAHGSVVYTVTGTVGPGAANSTLGNTAQIVSAEDVNASNDSDADATFVGGVDLQLTQDDHVTSVHPGDVIQYVLTYKNGGFVTATGVKLSDIVPANTVFDAAHSTAGWTGVVDGSPAGTPATFNIAGGVAPTDAPVSVTFAVRVASHVTAGAATIDHAASISDDLASGADSAPADNMVTDANTLIAAPDLKLTVAVDKSVVVRGQTLHYTYSYSNVGDQDAAGAFITATVPTGAHFNFAESNLAWSQTGPNTFEFAIASLPAGQTASSVTFAVDVDTAFTAGLKKIDGTATIDDDHANGTDPVPANNTALSSTTLYDGIYIMSQSRGGGEIGLGAAPIVKTYDVTTGATSSFLAYERTYTSGVRVAVGDLNGDGFLDIVTATRTGTGRIRVFDGLTHTPIALGGLTQINAFTGREAHGAYVALSDVTGDGTLDIIASSGLGGGTVKVFDGKTGTLVDSATPFGRTYRGGIRVAGGDVDGDGRGDIVAGQSVLGSKVAVYTNGLASTPLIFSAGTPRLRDGVFLATGDTQGDGVADIIVGRGAGGGRGASIGIYEVDSRPALVSAPTATEIKSIPLSNTLFRFGARVAAADLNFDGVADIIAAAGPLGHSRVLAFEGDGTALPITPTAAFPSPTLGVFVAAGNPLFTKIPL